jgi:uncharacterized membrane protein YccC
MSRRSKVDLYGLLDRVIYLYEQEKKSIAEIEQILRAEGYDISRESIRRKIKSSREIAEVYRKSLEEAKVLIDAVRSNPNTDVIEVTSSLLAHKLFEFSKTVEELDFQSAEEFIRAVQRLADAQVKVARLRLDYQKGFEAAKKEIIQALSLELAKEPELLRKLKEIINNVRAQE